MADRNEPQDNQTAPAAELSPCVGCGLCCDGTLFSWTRVKDNEEEPLTTAGLTVERDSEKRFFNQPCGFAQNGQCAIYAGRPTTCRVYRCKLLKGYESGAISREEALQTIGEALDLRSKVAAQDPRGVHNRSRQQLRGELAASRQRPYVALMMIAFDEYLDRYFRDEPANVSTSDGCSG